MPRLWGPSLKPSASTGSALGLIAGTCGLAAILWGIGLGFIGRHGPALIPFVYSFVTVLGLIHASLTGRSGLLKYSQLGLILLLPFVLMWSLGGFRASSMVMIWAIYAPISALIFFEKRTAILWFAAFLALVGISVLLDEHVAAWAVPLPKWAEETFFFLNGACCPAGLFFLISHYIEEKLRAIEALKQEQGRLERTQAELSAQKSKADELSHMLQIVLDTIPVRIFWKDTDLRYLGCNQLFAVDAGATSPKDIIGKNDYALSWHESAELYRSDDRQVIESGQSKIGFEEPQTHQDGTVTWLRTSKIRLHDENGSVLGILGTYEDITWEKTIERELLDSKEAAEAGSAAKSNFLAQMSHEIRTPMNAILGLAHILRDEISDPQQLARISRITESAKHLLGLITDILDLSKIEANSLQLEEIPLDITATVHEAASLVSDLASEKGLQLIEEVDRALAGMPLLGDPLRIRQILINYANNAVKFTTHGSVTFKAELLEQTADRAMVRFEVIDTGIGVADEARSRIFEPFEQAEKGTTRKYGGTGLGLAIVKRLAELMGGQAGVVTRSGVGSTFWFTALFHRGVGSSPSGVEPRKNVRKAARLLLVEDNDINQLVAQALLERMGLVVDVANHGGEALAKVLAADYDLVLMDLAMPVMDGLECTRRIRAAGKTVPIVAMTANAFQQEEDSCRAVGMNDFITKPVDPLRFEAMLARWIPEQP